VSIGRRHRKIYEINSDMKLFFISFIYVAVQIEIEIKA